MAERSKATREPDYHSTMKTINFTRAKLDAFKAKYDEARMKGQDTFKFEERPIFVPYAKYLIEYLETKFKPDTREVPEPDNLN